MASHWNLPQSAGKEVQVVTFTNCSAVELLVNGTSMGAKRLADFPDEMITWTIPYQPGRVRAHGIDEGKVAAVHELQTAGEPAAIRLNADHAWIRADGRDLCYVDAEIIDKAGVLVPSAEHEIRFSVNGPGAIVGFDNGDVTSMESYKAKKRKAFSGRAQVIIQALRTPGAVTLEAEADKLGDASTTIQSR